MGRTFAEAVEGWIFCGVRLLVHKVELGRALVRTEGDRDVVRRMREKLAVEAVAAKELDGKPIVIQTNGAGLYAGPLVGGRFQVMESVVPAGTYYVVDHLTDDFVRERGLASPTRRFTRAEAEAYAKDFTSDTGGGNAPLADAPSARTKWPILATRAKIEEEDMAKAATAAKAAPKPGRETLPKAAKAAPSPASPAPRGRKAEAAAEPSNVMPIRGRKGTIAAPPVPEPTGRDTVNRTGIGARTKGLILDGLDNAEIVKILAKEFPQNTGNQASNVNWYRNKLKNEGGSIPSGRRK